MQTRLFKNIYSLFPHFWTESIVLPLILVLHIDLTWPMNFSRQEARRYLHMSVWLDFYPMSLSRALVSEEWMNLPILSMHWAPLYTKKPPPPLLYTHTHTHTHTHTRTWDNTFFLLKFLTLTSSYFPWIFLLSSHFDLWIHRKQSLISSSDLEGSPCPHTMVGYHWIQWPCALTALMVFPTGGCAPWSTD